MLSNGLKWMTLNDPDQGELKLLVAVPKGGDPWGRLAPLRGTPWEDRIAVVSGEAMSHAMHGWATPLVREIGLAPHYRIRKVPEEEGWCWLHDNGCVLASEKCKPGSDVPDCYEGRADDPELRRAISHVVLAWAENRYVLVVEGEEFSLS